MAPHSSTLAWKIPWMEEPGRLQSMGLLPWPHSPPDPGSGGDGPSLAQLCSSASGFQMTVVHLGGPFSGPLRGLSSGLGQQPRVCTAGAGQEGGWAGGCSETVDVGVAGRGVTRVGLQARLPGEVVVLTESRRLEKEPVLLEDEPGLRHAASGPGCHRVVWEDSQSGGKPGVLKRRILTQAVSLYPLC